MEGAGEGRSRSYNTEEQQAAVAVQGNERLAVCISAPLKCQQRKPGACCCMPPLPATCPELAAVVLTTTGVLLLHPNRPNHPNHPTGCVCAAALVKT